ncbi:histidine kinase [Usitatibacter palustris]|uniref:Histidine kinase/HSP90-like ATPase domain-containing protein n=1 Tax=Usitatibacter palustris TaxID=2732487 RepID=A0A6M4HC09_9PROT|nr:histidine kinase [Usitatibacter palustris]QJR16782.1 hypothetical protein DSM104440_03618 [Usitatibacter palustris]
MKSSLSNILNKTPWWALILGAITVMIGLAFFVVPYHIIGYRQFEDPEHSRAIKREIDNTFAEQAINLARNVVRGMRDATRDEERRAELDTALEGLEEARRELREAGSEVLRSKRDALEQMNEAARRTTEAVREARREAERALKGGGIDNSETRRHLEESLKAAEDAEKEARLALKENARETARQAKEAAKLDKEVAKVHKEVSKLEQEKAKAAEKEKAKAEADKQAPTASLGITIGEKGGPVIRIDPDVDMGPMPDLPPELRAKIQRNVVGDMYRIGIGAVLVMILLPMFVLAVIAKFFIDRSRAAQRQAELKRKEADYHRLTQQVTEAKLAALQAQVEPHFLYNTLASVQALTEVDPAQASAMTGHLIQYLRNALPKMRESVSTVGQEIELVRAFLNILQMRMGKRLTFDINVPAELEPLSFPPLMLPSLVENAIKHGLEPQREGGNVRITAERVEGKLRLIVADTGKGFAEAIGSGVGLTNIRERLAALYGDAAKLTMEANEPQGVVATLEVPTDGTRAPAPMPPAPEEAVPPASAAASPAAATLETGPDAPKTKSQQALAVMATMERWWRKALSYVFVAAAVCAVVVAFAAFVAMLFGELPVEIGNEALTGPGGAIVGTLGILVGLLAVVLALAIVTVVIYGLGFLIVGIAIFVPLVVIAGLSPVLAPIALIGVLIWWLMKKNKKEPVPATPK